MDLSNYSSKYDFVDMGSIGNFSTFSFSFNGFDFVFGAGSSALSIVIFSFLSAVGVVPSVGGNGVPKSIGFGSSGISFDDIAGTEVGFEGSSIEGDEGEVGGGVVTFKVKAFQIAVVPCNISKRSSSLNKTFLGSVPVVMGSEEIG